MKNVFLGLLFVCMSGFAQEKLVLTPKGYDPVITNVEGTTAEQLKTKTKEWVQIYYKNPSEVLKAEIGNELMRIEGFCQSCYGTKSLGMISNFDVSYVLEIGFKDGKYRYEYIITKMSIGGKQVMYSYDSFFKEDGSVRKVYQYAFDTMNDSVNENYLSLYDFITGKTMAEKNKW